MVELELIKNEIPKIGGKMAKQLPPAKQKNKYSLSPYSTFITTWLTYIRLYQNDAKKLRDQKHFIAHMRATFDVTNGGTTVDKNENDLGCNGRTVEQITASIIARVRNINRERTNPKPTFETKMVGGKRVKTGKISKPAEPKRKAFPADFLADTGSLEDAMTEAEDEFADIL
jgi:hypothetical protein